MSLHDLVTINTHYTRSVNLERDSSSVDVVNAYIPTSRALRTLQRIGESFNDDISPRAWSLIGPYGSGKSSFSVFLSHLLSPPPEDGAKASIQILKRVDRTLGTSFEKETKGTDGYLKVLITGSPEPLTGRLIKALAKGAEDYWATIRGRNPKVISELIDAASREPSTNDVVALISELQEKLASTNCKGILLVIDELGKFLEYEARHYGANDIYLLQALAEHACKGHKANLFLFVLLHQSFEQYAKGLGESLKNEWAKVQGRFEEVPFVESAEQVLRVVSAAFTYSLKPQQQKALTANTSKTVQVLKKQEALPNTLAIEEANELFSHCFPLHPVTAVLLPLLCQKVAQNERTLFSYLGSHEDFGLQHMLDEMDDINERIYPHHIYDYFINNQPAVLGDYLTHRRWAEVVTAIERLGDASTEEVDILKTIGILNIVGSKGGLKASKAILETCLPSKVKVNHALKKLSAKSVINLRRFNGEYRVWQGSDFDLDDAVQTEINNVGQFSLAEALNNERQMPPVVARKYTIQKGTLRYFIPIFVDAKSFRQSATQAENPRIVFYLAADKADEKLFESEVTSHFSDLDIVSLSLNGEQLREAVTETLALRRVGANCQELNSDPVAKREFEDRLLAAEHSETKLLQNLLDSPQENLWYNKGENYKVANKRAMQTLLSEVLEQAYDKAPLVFNELINRDRPSSQANAARNKLLYLMQTNGKKENLGIDKFPPEKAIYQAVLRATGLHRHIRGKGWKFTGPYNSEAEDKANMRHVWQRIDEFLDSTEKKAKSLVELNNELLAPPYGVKAGLLPIIFMTVYLVYQHELALYEQGRYKPYFTEDMLDRFVKRPDEYEFQRFRISGMRASIFEQYSKVIHGDSQQRTLLELAQPLAKFMGSLPEYTQKTRRGLTRQAVKVRSAFDLAKSPEKLLFKELPEALGFSDIDSMQSEEEMERFSEKLITVLRELKDAYDALLDNQRKLLAQAFKLDSDSSLSEIRRLMSANCHGLENYTVDMQGLRAFIMRITKPDDSDDEWLENLLMFLGNKPSRKWLDSDVDTAEYRLSDLSRRFIDLEKLRLYEKEKTAKIEGDFDVYLLRSIKKGSAMLDEVVAVSGEGKKKISHTKDEIRAALADLNDRELMLGALAEMVDEFMTEYKHSQKQQNQRVEEESLTYVEGA